MLLLSSVDFFSKLFFFSKIPFMNISGSRSGQTFCWFSALGPNCLQRFSADDKNDC